MKKILFALGLAALSAGAVFVFLRRVRSFPAASYPAEQPTHDEVAEQAYFIGVERQARGEPADPDRDWAEAERLLAS